MFSGIIEIIGIVENTSYKNDNLLITISSSIANELKSGDSIAHNGICLTVVENNAHTHKVIAAAETLNKTNLKSIKKTHLINLERAIIPTSRLDGHIVQGHVDDIATCTNIEALSGSHIFTFSYNPKFYHLLIEKGSVALNGISLTTINVTDKSFSISIIPYTLENTNLHSLKIGDTVNLEFDIIGKYITRMATNYK